MALGGVFGALRDASPDSWGRRVIQRHLGKAQPGEMEYPLHSPDDRAGALGFGLNLTPPAPKRAVNQTLDLEKVRSSPMPSWVTETCLLLMLVMIITMLAMITIRSKSC